MSAPIDRTRQGANMPTNASSNAPANAPARRTPSEIGRASDGTPMTDNTAAEDAAFREGLLDAIPSLRAFGISLIGAADRADDLVQETLVKAWAKQASFVPGTNLKAWLFTILRNEFYTQMRKRGREVTDTEGIHASKLAGHPEQHGHLDMQDFRTALDTLPADQREAIILVGASGFSYEEAAEVCECAVGTIKSRVSRARARLADILSVEGETDYGPDDISLQMIGRQTFSGA